MKRDKTILVGIVIFIFVFSLFSSTGSIAYICSGKTQHIDSSIVLITGFEPFDIYDINPSQLIAEELNGQIINGVEVVGIVLPVDFDKSVENVTQAIKDYHPVIVLSLGLSARTRVIEVEKCGVNLKKLPRNESPWILPRRIDPCGPFIRLSALDTREIVVEIRNADIPVKQSFFAGMYVCNAVLYEMLGYINEYEPSTRAGFIHVPFLASQDPDGMELEMMVEAVTIAIQTSLD